MTTVDVNIDKLSRYKTPERFRERLTELGIDLPFVDSLSEPGESPLAEPLQAGPHRIGSRFCIFPMEGWDGTDDGKPSDLVHRRWKRFG